MSEFNLDKAEFDVNDFDEEVLDMQEGVEINSNFMNVEDPNEISMNVSLRNKSPEEITREVEGTFLDLLKTGDRDMILSLTGENPDDVGCEDSDVIDQFRSMYTVATMYNPAVRWYSKLTKMLPKGKFVVGDSGLNLKIKESTFKKAIVPFLGDFKADLREDSPIVSLVYSIMDTLRDTSTQEQLNRALEQDGKKADPGQFNVAEVDLEENQLDVDNVEIGEVHVDDNGGFGNTEVKRTDRPDISLLDLANKTIAEHLIEENQTDFETIKSKLTGEGFTKSRVNEIFGIIKFINLNKNIDGRVRQEGNIGAGNVNFDFR